MTNEEILKAARQHEKNAKRHPKNSYLYGWHQGSSATLYNILRSRLSWKDYRKLTGF